MRDLLRRTAVALIARRARRILEIHVDLPDDDAVAHEPERDCPCGPDVRYVEDDDRRIVPVAFHHRLVP